MEMCEKVLTFLTHKSKPLKLQTMLVLVKVLSCQYHSYPLTQLDFIEKCLCKYYISMISRNQVKQGGGFHGFPPFWDFFQCLYRFWAPRRVLGAIKIATESLEPILRVPIFWSTCVDLLVNISIPFVIVHVRKRALWISGKRDFPAYKRGTP